MQRYIIFVNNNKTINYILIYTQFSDHIKFNMNHFNLPIFVPQNPYYSSVQNSNIISITDIVNTCILFFSYLFYFSLFLLYINLFVHMCVYLYIAYISTFKYIYKYI